MIEGVENDDKYRMVEDEFVTVAGDFTKHLHAAEYQRLKTLAKSQNADAISSISRPVTGEMTDLVRRRQKALGLAASQRRGIHKVLGRRDIRIASDDEEPWFGTSLQGLMDSPRKTLPLTSVASAVAETRAAAGYRVGSGRSSEANRHPARTPASDLAMRDLRGSIQATTPKQDSSTDSEGDNEDEDEDNLDAPTVSLTLFQNRPVMERPKKSVPTVATTKPSASPLPQPPLAARTVSTQHPFRTSNSQQSKSNVVAHTLARVPPSLEKQPIDLTQDDNDDGDNDDFFARRRNQRDQKRKRSKVTNPSGGLDDIPFM